MIKFFLTKTHLVVPVIASQIIKPVFKTLYHMFKNIFISTIIVIAIVAIAFFYSCFTNPYQRSDAYIYAPENIRASYTTIPMFECSWCHRTNNLNRHHIVPQRANPALRNDFSNIIILCRDCHFVLGHRCNWKQLNPDVIEICNTYTNVIRSSIYNDKLNSTNIDVH